MSRRRDPLDASLSRLCSLAEQTVVLLRDIPVAREGFAAFRFDPDRLADELTRLAMHGRAVHTERLDAVQWADVAAEEAREVAQDAYDAQQRYRQRLAAVATLTEDPTAVDDLAEVARRLQLSRPRTTGALDTFRRLADHLARPDHVVRRHAATAAMPEEVDALVARLEAVWLARDRAARTRRIAVARAEEATHALRQALRRVRQMGEVVATLPRFPEALLSDLRTRPAPSPRRDPRTGPGSTGECAGSTSDPAEPTSDPAPTTDERAGSPSECAPTTSECAEMTSDPAGRSNLDHSGCPRGGGR